MNADQNNPNVMSRGLIAIGAAALLSLMMVDLVAVIGRQTGWAFLGSIEIAQALILVAALSAMLTATIAGAHAAVRFLLDRAGPRMREGLQRFNALASALFCLSLAAGLAIIAADLWNGHEQSEIIGLGYRPLRVLAVAGCAGLTAIFAVQVVRGARR